MTTVGSDPLEAGMSYIEILDYREQAHNQRMALEAEQTKRQLAIEKQRTRQGRRDVYVTFLVGLFIVAVILGIVFAIYKGTRPGPYSNKPGVGERREALCMQDGGTWLPGTLFNNDSGTPSGMCVMPGKAPTP